MIKWLVLMIKSIILLLVPGAFPAKERGQSMPSEEISAKRSVKNVVLGMVMILTSTSITTWEYNPSNYYKYTCNYKWNCTPKIFFLTVINKHKSVYYSICLIFEITKI